MNNFSLVSIITPAFQSARFIAETIESVQRQDYPRIEHIIMDGGSQDGTLDILKRYPHLVWVSEPDNGQSQALNKGFKLAKGGIVGWLNADDTYTPSAVSTAVRFLMENPHVHAVYSDQQIIDERGAPIMPSRSKPFNLADLFMENYIRQPTVFFRRHVLEELGGVDESLHYSMDREFWLRIGSRYTMHYIPDFIGANFRFHPNTKTFQDTPRFHAEWMRVMEQAVSDASYQTVPLAVKRMAFQQARVRFHVANMQKALRSRDPKLFFSQLILLVAQNWDYILSYPLKKLSRARAGG